MDVVAERSRRWGQFLKAAGTQTHCASQKGTTFVLLERTREIRPCTGYHDTFLTRNHPVMSAMTGTAKLKSARR